MFLPKRISLGYIKPYFLYIPYAFTTSTIGYENSRYNTNPTTNTRYQKTYVSCIEIMKCSSDINIICLYTRFLLFYFSRGKHRVRIDMSEEDNEEEHRGGG